MFDTGKIINLVIEDLKKEKETISLSYKPYLHLMYVTRSRLVHYCLIETAGNALKASNCMGTNRRTFNNALGFFVEEWTLFNLENNLSNSSPLVVEKSLNDVISLLNSKEFKEAIRESLSKFDLFIGMIKYQFATSLLHHFNDNLFKASLAFNFNRRTFANCLSLKADEILAIKNGTNREYYSTLKNDLKDGIADNEKLQLVGFYLEEDLIVKLEEMSRKNDRSLSNQFRVLLKEYLSNLKLTE